VENVVLSYLPLVAKQYIRLQNGYNFFIAVFDAAHDGHLRFFHPAPIIENRIKTIVKIVIFGHIQ
jgi:hypothetical protein